MDIPGNCPHRTRPLHASSILGRNMTRDAGYASLSCVNPLSESLAVDPITPFLASRRSLYFKMSPAAAGTAFSFPFGFGFAVVVVAFFVFDTS